MPRRTATSVALCAVVTLAVALAPRPAGAQSLASRLRPKSIHPVHHDTTRADSVRPAPSVGDTAAAKPGMSGRAGSLARSMVTHSPLGMQVRIARFYGSAIKTQMQHSMRYRGTALEMVDPKTATEAERVLVANGLTLDAVSLQHLDQHAMQLIAPVLEHSAATDALPSGAAQADTAFARIQTELRALETRATGGDTTAARQLTRFQLEMNVVAQRLAPRGATAMPGTQPPMTRALVKEMQRALDCARTGRGCQSAAAATR